MGDIFREKSYTKRGETSPRPFSKNLKLSISLDQLSKVFLNSLFLLYAKLRATKLLTNCFYLILSFFKKNKKRSETSLSALFSA